jgi:hypothetical protein
MAPLTFPEFWKEFAELCYPGTFSEVDRNTNREIEPSEPNSSVTDSRFQILHKLRRVANRRRLPSDITLVRIEDGLRTPTLRILTASVGVEDKRGFVHD